jgi:hypothetical protein
VLHRVLWFGKNSFIYGTCQSQIGLQAVKTRTVFGVSGMAKYGIQPMATNLSVVVMVMVMVSRAAIGVGMRCERRFGLMSMPMPMPMRSAVQCPKRLRKHQSQHQQKNAGFGGVPGARVAHGAISLAPMPGYLGQLETI